MRRVLGLQNKAGGFSVYLIQKSFYFSASHCLRLQDQENKCANLHGHNYTVTVAVQSDDLANGMVVDCAEITRTIDPILKRLDHSNLNDHFDWETTSENLACWFYNKLLNLNPAWVEVTETPNIKARYWR